MKKKKEEKKLNVKQVLNIVMTFNFPSPQDSFLTGGVCGNGNMRTVVIEDKKEWTFDTFNISFCSNLGQHEGGAGECARSQQPLAKVKRGLGVRGQWWSNKGQIPIENI